MTVQATTDPDVGIEEQREGYVRYVRKATGERWEVHGVCDHRGDCIVGAVIDGRGVTAEEAPALAAAYIGPDVPVGPGFSGCCPLKVVTL